MSVLVRRNLKPSSTSEKVRPSTVGLDPVPHPPDRGHTDRHQRGGDQERDSIHQQHVWWPRSGRSEAPNSGPAACATRGMTVSAAFARSMGIAARRARTGIKARRAVVPGVSTIAISNTSTRNCQKARTPVACSSGMAATATPPARSESTLAPASPTGPPTARRETPPAPRPRQSPAGKAGLGGAAGGFQNEPGHRQRSHRVAHLRNGVGPQQRKHRRAIRSRRPVLSHYLLASYAHCGWV